MSQADEWALYDAIGEPVGVTVRLPKFNPLADVIVWGGRTFVLNPDGPGGYPRYEEGMVWVVQPGCTEPKEADPYPPPSKLPPPLRCELKHVSDGDKGFDGDCG